jgi:hypothetical protein
MAKTVFDMQNASHRARVEKHLAALDNRTAEHLEALHYLVRADGRFQCLDVGLFAPSREELDAAVLEYCVSHSPTEVLPAAPVEDWLKMVAAELVGYQVLNTWPFRVRLVVATCREVE